MIVMRAIDWLRFRHHLDQVPEAELEAEILRHAQHNDCATEVTILNRSSNLRSPVVVLPFAYTRS